MWRLGPVTRAFATAAALTLHGACASESANPTIATDARADSPDDAGKIPMPDVGAQDAGPAPCSLGDGPVACAAALTGCPSTSVCSASGRWVCPCRACKFTLEADACTWTVAADYRAGSTVDRISEDGGTERLKEVTSGSCQTDEFGFTVSWAFGASTIALCPASCREHQDSPGILFTVDRGPCPPT
jgi:hypothetical protein